MKQNHSLTPLQSSKTSRVSKAFRSSRPSNPSNPSNSFSPAPHRHLPKPSSPSIPWQIGKYQNNSGIQNAINPSKANSSSHPGRSHSSLTPSWPVHGFDSQLSFKPKTFNSNSESKKNSNLPSQRSRINYQTSDYDLISHTVREQAAPSSVSRQKGLGQVFDALRPSRQEFFDEYQHSIVSEPKIFHKKVGEFSKYQDDCVRLSGKGPFYRGF